MLTFGVKQHGLNGRLKIISVAIKSLAESEPSAVPHFFTPLKSLQLMRCFYCLHTCLSSLGNMSLFYRWQRTRITELSQPVDSSAFPPSMQCGAVGGRTMSHARLEGYIAEVYLQPPRATLSADMSRRTILRFLSNFSIGVWGTSLLQVLFISFCYKQH